LQDDVLFGAEPWTAQMFYPLVQSKREHSTLRPGGAAVTELEMNQAASAKQEAA
ncbi:fatty acid hydroxylase, partial [Escherichia coli]|nr:fatty acid hydroxylase [Escherichia coli]